MEYIKHIMEDQKYNSYLQLKKKLYDRNEREKAADQTENRLKKSING